MAYSKPHEVIVIQKLFCIAGLHTLSEIPVFRVFRKGTVPPAVLAWLSGGLLCKSTCAFYFIWFLYFQEPEVCWFSNWFVLVECHCNYVI